MISKPFIKLLGTQVQTFLTSQKTRLRKTQEKTIHSNKQEISKITNHITHKNENDKIMHMNTLD